MNKIFIIFIVLFCGAAYADNYITQTVVGGCDANTLMTTSNNKTILKPVFEPIQYTCSSGQFLPANTTGCQICPNGATCPGGTFAFNEHKAQGITIPSQITQNTTKVCSTNILMTTSNNKTILRPVFEPVTVTLNYSDGVGNTTTKTCTYDGLVNLPPTPTREGYDFVGWKLTNN